MPPEFDLLYTLKRHGFRFVVIGGHAVNVHGYIRATEDTDIVWARSPASERALANALLDVKAKYLGRDVDPATGIEREHDVSLSYIQAHRLMMLWTEHGFLDVFDYVPGLPDEDPEQLFASSVMAHDLSFASLEWLRRMKRASGRAKDLLDLENLAD